MAVTYYYVIPQGQIISVPNVERVKRNEGSVRLVGHQGEVLVALSASMVIAVWRNIVDTPGRDYEVDLATYYWTRDMPLTVSGVRAIKRELSGYAQQWRLESDDDDLPAAIINGSYGVVRRVGATSPLPPENETDETP